MSSLETEQSQDPNLPDRPRILLVDDHEASRKAIARLLHALGFEVIDAGDGASALRMLGERPGFDFVLTDVRLPDIDGRDIVQAARQIQPAPRTGLMTGWDVEAGEQERLGVEWIFLKPLNVVDMAAQLHKPPPIRNGPLPA